jgi:hypothetical protein
MTDTLTLTKLRAACSSTDATPASVSTSDSTSSTFSRPYFPTDQGELTKRDNGSLTLEVRQWDLTRPNISEIGNEIIDL